MQRKHILFISSWYPNRNKPLHGIFNKYFAEAAAVNHDVSVLHVSSEENLKTEFEIQVSDEDGTFTVQVYYRKIKSALPFVSSLLKKNKMIRAFDLGYQELLKSKRKPDLIQLNVIMPAGLGAYHLSRKEHIPYVVNENWSGYMPEDGNYRGPLLQHFTKKIISRAKMILPTSNILKDAMLAHGLKGNYRVIPNVVNTDLFRIIPQKPSGEIQFLHISTLDDNPKNISGILRAFAALKNPGTRLFVAGEGPQLQKHLQTAKELGLNERVKFLGIVTGEELVKLINSCNALLMFSLYETFSLVMAEAMACGKPLISSKVGLAKDLPQDCGIIVETGNEKALTLALEKFVGMHNSFNPEKIREYAVKHFSREMVSKMLDEVYREVLK